MKIKFIASNQHVLNVREKPVPASTMLPEWWKSLPVYSNGKFDLMPYATVTAKKCFPLLDGLTSGYIVTLWSDILVTKDDFGNQIVKWVVSTPVLEAWPSVVSSSYEIPNGFNKTVYKYLHGWLIETPKNYSCLITHPVGYQNLPIRTLTAVIDTDRLETLANSPFVIREDFEGIIPKGTPMFQIIPFKRDSWTMQIDSINHEEANYRHDRLHSVIKSSYGTILRSKKEYR